MALNTFAAASTVTRRLRRLGGSPALAIACSYLGSYALLEWISHVRPLLKAAITPWNPQAGLTLALLILCGWRWWPLVAAAALATQIFIRHIHVAPILIVSTSLWVAIAYAAIAALLRRSKLLQPLRTASDAAGFAGIAILGTLLVAAGYVGLFVMAGEVSAAEAISGSARYWVGDLNGILPLTPLLIYIGEWRARLRALQLHRLEIAAQLAAVVLMLVLTFLLPAADQLRFFYLLFVPIIWIALRWRWPGAMLAVLVIQAGLLVVAETRIATARFIDLQFLMLTLTLTGLLLGAVVAERQRAAEQLRERDAALARAMRFAVAGELASALAHELNQPIAALVSYLQAAEILANGSASSDDRLQPTLTKATREAIRASAVLRRLRDFYRSGTLKNEPVDVPSLCATVASAFQERLRRADASLGVSVDATIPQLAGDATQLEVVLHNVVANALDAVAQSSRPRRIELSAAYAEGRVTLQVEDSGAGLAAELCSRLFEPFVTSKPEGMGLGLAISRSLILARGGELSFGSSTALRGASFIIVLPVAAADATLFV